ncbi:MAG: BrnT family toxin [Selenomonadaceae bacterium]|nr:BrnT family toxin [Selenomonadaceae bacterium]MBQ7630607.1 BrnT family toxin [Selenomonadaceae bacterium]
MQTLVSGLWFEWDDMKSMINEFKHGVSFQDAALVFEDEFKITRKDTRHSQNEERFQTIGMVEDVLFVVHTARNERIRIISARAATEKERADYYGDGDLFPS